VAFCFGARQAFVKVELPWLTVYADGPPVMQPVRDVAGLLNLEKEHASTSCVNCSGSNIEGGSLLDGVVLKKGRKRAVPAGQAKLAACEGAVESQDDLCALACVHNEPGFVFAGNAVT
jgi:hypothetical protein